MKRPSTRTRPFSLRQIETSLLFVALAGLLPLSATARPQDPERPLPYDEEEVSYETADGKIRLTGTLTLPRSEGRHPAVYLIPGGSPFDRDETIVGHRPFLVLSHFLTRRGFVVLRMDDRGVGDSTGSKLQTPLEDLASDVVQAVEFLEDRPEVDPARIGLIGHSLGAILAPIVASRSTKVGFVVLLAGSGETWMQYIARQNARDGIGELATNLEMARRADSLLGSGAKEVTLEGLERDWDLYIAEISEERREAAKAFKNTLPGLGPFLALPPLRDMMKHDPAAVLAKTRIPVLALAGDRDPMALMLPRIKEALESGGNADFTVRELPDLNHMFQTITGRPPGDGGSPRDWQRIDETFSPRALDTIGSWLDKRTARR